MKIPNIPQETPHSATPANLRASLVDAFRRLPDAADDEAAVLLLAAPIDAALGVDLSWDAETIRFRDLTIGRSGDIFDDAVALWSATPQSCHRNLAAADPVAWVGRYRSGARVYTSGLWPMFSVSELSVRPDLIDVLPTVMLRLVDGDLSQTSRHRFQVGTVKVMVTTSKRPADLPTLVDADDETSDELPTTDIIEDPFGVIDDAAADLASTFSALSTTLVPLEGSPEHVLAELLMTLDSGDLISTELELFTSPASLLVGIPDTRVLSLPSFGDIPDGFDHVGRERFEGLPVARHSSGVTVLVHPRNDRLTFTP